MGQETLEPTVDLIERLRRILPNVLREGTGDNGQDAWHVRAAGRPVHQQLSLLLTMYDTLLQADLGSDGNWAWKATTLVRISDCFRNLNFNCLAKRYAMLALCDEASRREVQPTDGSYQRLLVFFGMLETEIQRYAGLIRILAADGSEYRRFPESVLLDLDDDWMSETPSIQESSQYFLTTNYLRYLLSKLSWFHEHKNEDSAAKGHILERLAAYTLFCMPGARIRLRVKEDGTGTDHDVVCTLEGHTVDFRTELGRYLIAECKAHKEKKTPLDVAAKFARALTKVKSKFGILFCPQGITGQFKDENAQKEQLDLFRDSGIVMILLTEENLQHVGNGRNLINILRFKYDQIRLFQTIKPDDLLDAVPHGWYSWMFVAPPQTDQTSEIKDA